MRAERDIYEFNKIFWTNNDLEKIFTKLQRKEKLIGLEQVFVSGFKEFSKKEKNPPNLDQIKKILEITISRCEEEFSKRGFIEFLFFIRSSTFKVNSLPNCPEG